MPLFIGGTLLGSAVLGAAASNKASKAQQGAAQNANQIAQQQYQETTARNQPYLNLGNNALGNYGNWLGVGPNTGAGGYGAGLAPYTGASLTNDPGYQFGMREGLKPLQSQLNRTGSLYGGGALKAIDRYGQDYAGTKFNEGFQRDLATKQYTAGQYQYPINIGQSAANNTAAAGQNYSTAAGSNLAGGANAVGAGAIGGVNAFTGALGTGINYLQGQQYVDALNQRTALLQNQSGYGSSPVTSGWGAG